MAVGIEILGFVGGASISASLIPQVIKTYRTKSATDISYIYQAIYILGTSMVNVYALIEGLWPVYVPCIFEEIAIITLTVMKFVCDRREERSRLGNSAEVMASGGTSTSTIGVGITEDNNIEIKPSDESKP